MKKITALILSLVLITCFSACGESGNSEEATKANAGASAEQDKSDQKEDADDESKDQTSGGAGTLTVWCWDPAFNLYAMEEAEKVYQQDNPDFSLNIVEVPWEDIQTRITTAMSSGDTSTLPDILLCQNNAYQKNTINYPDLFVDLTDSGIAFDKFGESAVAYSVIDGKNYGVPFDNGTSINAMRIDILEEAGFTIADFTDITWEEYLEKGKVVLEKTGKPLLSGASDSRDLLTMMLQSAGSSLFDEDGNPNITGNDVLREAIDIHVRLIQEGVMLQVNNWDEYIATFINGNVTGTINGCWILASVQTADDQSGLWGITNLPKMSMSGSTNYSANGGSSWGLTQNCQDVDLAIDFLSKTFAGSVDFYETILPASGALANYLPAGDSDVYASPQPFFADQPIYSDIVGFGSHVPNSYPGAYYYEARDAVGVALVNILNGSDLESELQNAEDTINFAIGA